MEDTFVNVDAQKNEAKLWAYPWTPKLTTEWIIVKLTVFQQMCWTRPVRSLRRSFTPWSSLACLFTKCVHFKDLNSLVELVWGMVVEGWGLGHHEYLCQYETDRQRHNLATMVGVDCLQKLYCTSNTPMVLARSLRVKATNAAQAVNKLILQHAGKEYNLIQITP